MDLAIPFKLVQLRALSTAPPNDRPLRPITLDAKALIAGIAQNQRPGGFLLTSAAMIEGIVVEIQIGPRASPPHSRMKASFQTLVLGELT